VIAVRSLRSGRATANVEESIQPRSRVRVPLSNGPFKPSLGRRSRPVILRAVNSSDNGVRFSSRLRSPVLRIEVVSERSVVDDSVVSVEQPRAFVVAVLYD